MTTRDDGDMIGCDDRCTGYMYKTGLVNFFYSAYYCHSATDRSPGPCLLVKEESRRPDDLIISLCPPDSIRSVDGGVPPILLGWPAGEMMD